MCILLLLFIISQGVYYYIFNLYFQYESNTFLDFIKKDFDSNEDKTKRYEIKKEFQKGGFGNIFLAYDNKEKKEVVIKKIDKNKIKEEIFNREIKTMKEIKCDYSVEIYDYYNDNNYYYIVMEKCDGDLFDLLENKKGFSESEIKTILLQLNVALKNMYSKNIIHRDLKPENIFIKYTHLSNIGFIVKLGDFGLSREYQQRQFSSNQINPTYVAPEIQEACSENKSYDPTKCDLWSIGLIIYNLRFYKIPYFSFCQGKYQINLMIKI